jgi:hypothetical protein
MSDVRPGLIVQNAATAGTNLDLAEPDALDFKLLGNQRHGVITGCRVSVSGSSYTISVAPGVAVVDGALVLTGGTVTLPTFSQSARFDLITVDGGGTVGAVVGTADPNPIFPVYDDTVTVLAAVYISPGGGWPAAGDVTDKRIMLTTRYQTAVKDGSLLHNSDPIDLHPNFDIAFDGHMVWDGDGTALERSGVKTLRVHDNLDVVASLTAHDLTTVGDLVVNGDIIATNFQEGHGPPSGTATLGDLYKNLDDGAIWAYQNPWAQLSTVPIPAGMTMTGFMTTAPPGWLLVSGQTISKAQAGGLWQARPDWQLPNGTQMKIPDARDCYFGWGPPGTKFGNLSPQVQIQTANLPPHKHLTSPTTAAGGSHGHTVQQAPAGAHSHLTVADGYYGGAHVHGVNDPGHVHYASDEPNVGAIICTYWGGQNKLDGLFNDASHTYSVEPVNGVRKAVTGVSITTEASNHQHVTDTQGQHTHGFAIDPTTATHQHPIDEQVVGSGAPLDIRPPTMGMYLFVKT